MDLIDILKTKKIGDEVRVEGWIRNHRRQKEFGFIDFYDGTSFETLQIVYDKTNANFDEIQKMLVGCAIIVDGKLVESSGNQEYELKASNVLLVGECDETYPIQPKRHTQEFLRSVAHLRPRTRLFQAVFKIRNLAAYAIHEYFQSHNYVYVHTPLFTTSDCEGENQMFKVTTLDLENINKNEDGKVDYKADLFGKPTFITGTGQLHGEAYAMAFKKIYTFGPTFRTENSNTKTHANEFWMIEPEIAFCDLDGLMDIEEEMLKSIVSYVLKNGEEEIKFLNNFVDKNLKEKLEKLVNSNFVRITHHEAVDLLKKADIKWEFTPDYESDIAKEHEKYITEYYNAPVFITNWPKDIKAWYMKENSDGKTVAAVDLEVPGAGELMGGSQREEDYEKLVKRAENLGVDTELIDWFMDLRKYGSCYHSGFGMGFERLIIYLTGVENIRDVIPFPRTPGNCEY
ncbi:MAG: asparagine--tRNA ligase [Bacilli bacterium]|jgi:asparaginyl-tRNA synthetase|nr:asparagine--tRNA ligase [Bacilli bacterium]